MTQNYYFYNLKQIFTTRNFKGWGRKKTGKFATLCHKIFKGNLTLLEDGFIRSLGLGVQNSPAFSWVEDEYGIYYDATQTSALEKILNTYDFGDSILQESKKAIEFIKKHEISKYNHSQKVPQDFFKTSTKRILIIAQTHHDLSLKYGYGNIFSTKTILQDALKENPSSDIYLKIHPDVLSGLKESDFNLEKIPPQITIITQDFNPISLLKYFDKVYTKTSQMGFEALMMGCECVTYGMPFYAGWGLTIDKQTCPRRTRKLSLEELFAGAYILYCHYYNPIYQRKSDIFDTLKTIKKYSYQSSSKKAFMFGFSFWKHHFIFGYSQKKPNFIQPFLQEFDPKNIIFIHPVFCDPLSLALKKGLNADCEIFIWGRKTFDSIESFAKANTIKLVRVEDGFIRSLSLGSDLTRPFSLVFDDMGIYFDPNTPSRLENILENTTFTADLLEEASCLKKQILTSKISKYNIHKHATLNLPKDKTILLVIGQVEDDASILFGARGRGNQSLLEQVRHENPKAYILYKPHPDVLSGNRLGHIKTQIALQYCDKIIENISLHSAIQASHEIHTLTSLSGLEALMYGKKVVTYGMPFYAGWGLTIDKQTCPRRTRKLSLEELIAGVYLLYPRYIHPKTLQYCCAEVLIKCLQQDQKKLHESISETFKNKIYTFFSRKIQKLFRKIL